MERYCTDGLAQLTPNRYLVLVGTLHDICAISGRPAPTGSRGPGAQASEGESFKLTLLLMRLQVGAA